MLSIVLADVDVSWMHSGWVWALVALFVVLAPLLNGVGLRYIDNNRVGVVEKLWSPLGAVAADGILALAGEAGYQAALLRGGLHLGFWLSKEQIERTPINVSPPWRTMSTITRATTASRQATRYHAVDLSLRSSPRRHT